MKSSDNTKFHFCKPKYQWIWSSLIILGCVLAVGIQYGFPKAPHWIGELGVWAVCIGLIVFVFGTIAARREWEAKRKTETK
jgi:protein-S-isoprenylcysteine O-methyltransferase Ste14